MSAPVVRRYVNQSVLSFSLLIGYQGATYLTSPSIFTPIAFTDSLLAVLTSLSIALTILSLCILIFWIADQILSRVVRSKRMVFLPLLPCLIYAILVLVLLDNTLRITVNFRIYEQPKAYAHLYLLISLCIMGLGLWRTDDEAESRFNPVPLLVLSSITTIVIGICSLRGPTLISGQISSLQTRPDIFLLGIDGVAMEDTSLLRSTPDTTPSLRDLSGQSLLFEHAYAEGNYTANSLMAIWTSLSPLESGLVGYPQLVNGAPSKEHLFNLLEQAGYHTYQFTIRRFGDAFDGNLRGGIEEANGRSLRVWNSNFLSSYPQFHNSLEFNFLVTSFDEIVRVVGTALLLIPSEHSMQHFSIPGRSWAFRDSKLLEDARNTLPHAESPVFMHLHLSGTHGPFFEPRVLKFSEGSTQSAPFQQSFYQDAILTADQDLANFLDYLKSIGKFENSLIIVYSDHDLLHRLNARVPLLVKLPHSKQGERILEPVTLSDISSTIVELMEIERPGWMQGRSLTKRDRNSSRVLYTAGASPVATKPLIDRAGAIYCGNKIEYLAEKTDCSIVSGEPGLSCPDSQLMLTKLCSELKERLAKLRSAPTQKAFFHEILTTN
ncbi:MAG: sulfatase-like hydrolase/transferase [Deltaproteobacteria bacterium]|nr:sulfatase-like hydrolase/transferase [Deltaproteobacteria bacterium]